MAIYFQNNNKTQASIRNTITLIDNAYSPQISNYDQPNKDAFGSDQYIQSNLQFCGIFNMGKKQYKRISTTNHS